MPHTLRKTAAMNAIETQLDSPFYVTGGTLSRDALCYVTRQADHELYDCLCKVSLAYVLTARQMGKSSLMVRTASRLRDEGAGVVVLDLTAIGQNLSAEQWYGGLLTQMAQQLGIEDELEEFWDSHAGLGPLQRWMQAVRRVVLPRYPGHVLIFIDEIDAVRSLPFSTDEFFAGIREFFNHRTEDPELERLSFCLLGVAAPSDLIRDTRMTPFNIGQRIELYDFTKSEARGLAFGLGGEQDDALLLGRVLYWTGGHPYLTQRLCQAAAEQGASSAREVDRLCGQLFFASRAREQDDNLLFVRERMLRSEVDLAGLLHLYEQVRRGRRVEDDETNPFVTILKLSGITRIEDGRLLVRNRIYERVFDQAWVAQNMPDAEVRRQRAAYRKGLLRAAAFAAVIVIVIASLAFVAIRQRNLARAAEETNRRQLYAAHMNLAARDWQDSNIEHMRELLSIQLPQPGQADLRGFEWYLLWALAHPERKTLPVSGEFTWIVFSPDFKIFASCDRGSATLWDMATNTQVRAIKTGGLFGIAIFSPDGNLLATDSADHSIRLWDLSPDAELHRFTGHTDSITDLHFSSDGKMLASASVDRTAMLWDVETGNSIATLKGHAATVNSINFSPDGKKVATASDDLSVKLWDVATGKQLMEFKEHPVTSRQSNMRSINRVVFSPDGSRILATGRFMNVAVWDSVTGEALPALEGHSYYLSTLAFSSDGKLMATGSEDRTILLWDVGTWSVIKRLIGHGNRINELAFSPDSKTLASAGQDGTIKLWDVAADPNPLERAGAQLLAYSSDGKRLVSTYRKEVRLWDSATWREISTFVGGAALIISLAYSPDGTTVALGTADNKIALWDVTTGKERLALRGHSDQVWYIAFSPDGKMLATGSYDKTLRLWDAATGDELAKLEEDENLHSDVAFSPTGRLLASGSGTSIKLWDVATRGLVATLKGHTSEIEGVVFSPDGKLLASTSADSTVKLWDVATHQALSSLKGHAGLAFSPVFSPDSKRLATAGLDFTVRVWDVANGQELSTFRRHTAPVWDVAFSPDGKTLVSAGRDGILRVWRAATEKEVQSRGN